jgi:hypothetical protein
MMYAIKMSADGMTYQYQVDDDRFRNSSNIKGVNNLRGCSVSTTDERELLKRR